MTVLIAKVISHIVPVPAVSDGQLYALANASRALYKRFSLRPEWFSAIFIALTLIAAVTYIFEINVIVLDGRKIPALESTLRELEHGQKQKRAQLAALRAPLVIKKEAVRDGKMVGVDSIRYVRDSEEVASTFTISP